MADMGLWFWFWLGMTLILLGVALTLFGSIHK